MVPVQHKLLSVDHHLVYTAAGFPVKANHEYGLSNVVLGKLITVMNTDNGKPLQSYGLLPSLYCYCLCLGFLNFALDELLLEAVLGLSWEYC